MKIISLLFLVFFYTVSAHAEKDQDNNLPQLGEPQKIGGGKIMSIGGKGIRLQYLLNKNGGGSLSLQSDPHKNHFNVFGETITNESTFKFQHRQLVLEFKF